MQLMNRNKLDPDIRSSTSYNLFRDILSKFIKPAQAFNVSFGRNLLFIWNKVVVGLGFSHLCKQKFRHGFRNMLNLLCPSNIEVKTIAHCVAISIMQTG